MSDSKYTDIYNEWRRKATNNGFTLNEFRCAYNRLVEPRETCAMTKAIGAKMAYRSLVRNKEAELKLVQREMENMRWF